MDGGRVFLRSQKEEMLLRFWKLQWFSRVFSTRLITTVLYGLSLPIYSPVTLATQAETYGLGGSTTSRVSGVTADDQNPFAALYNPALMAAQKRSLFSLSSLGSQSNYSTFSNVLVDSAKYRTRDGAQRVDDFTIPGSDASLWAIGFTYPFSLPKYLGRRAGLGLVASGPFGKLRSFSSGTPYEFTPLRYGTADRQFKATASLGSEVIPEHLYWGAGLSFYITAAGAASADIVTINPTGRLNLDVGMNSSLVAGLYGKSSLWGLNQAWSLVFHQAATPTFDQRFDGTVQVAGASIVVPLLLHTALYYEPQTIESDWQVDFGLLVASIGVSYQRWSSFEPSFLTIQSPDAQGQMQSTSIPNIPFSDTLNPRLSIDVPLIRNRFYASTGYEYRPSPMKDLSGPANLVDSNTHVLGLGLRLRVPDNEVIPIPVTVSLYGQYQWIASRHIEKSDPTYIGNPGYDFSGNAYTYGVSLQADL